MSYTYIWVGPHHLHYTSIPDWLMTAAMAMSIILILPYTTIAQSHLEHPHTLYKIETNYKGLLSC
jgi:cbb3-type cytochrome oxidase subunit 1